MRLSKCALVLSLLWLFNMLHSVIVEGVKCLICSDASAGRLISENKCHVERSGLLRCQHKEIKRRNARRRCSNSFCSAILEFSSHPWILSCGFFKGGPDYVWASQLSRFFFSPHIRKKAQIWSCEKDSDQELYSTIGSKNSISSATSETNSDWEITQQ